MISDIAYMTLAAARAERRTAVHLSDSELRHSATTSPYTSFDVFLCHAVQDADVVLGVKHALERQGLSVYVDWIDDRQLDRRHVTPATADTLRNRMNRSGFLLYASTSAAATSRWMPWELGYFDGHRPDSVGVLPLLQHPTERFVGAEYVGLYPTFELDTGRRLIRRSDRQPLSTLARRRPVRS